MLAGSAAGSWGGNSALKGDAATPESVGETGEGGGGGSLRETGGSLVFVFSLTESLFRPCSKNTDFVLVPVSFCTQQKQTQTLRKYHKDSYKIRTKGDTGTCYKIWHSTTDTLQCSTVGLESSSKPRTNMFIDMRGDLLLKCHKRNLDGNYA